MSTWTQTERLYPHFTPDMKSARSPGYSRTVGNRRATIRPQGRGWTFDAFIGKRSVIANHQSDDMATREDAERTADMFLNGGEYFEV